MDKEKIILKIQQGLKECAEKHIILPKDVQFKISNDGSVDLLNINSTVAKNIDICKIFKVSKLENLLFPIVPYLKKTVQSLATKKDINPNTAYARVFTKGLDFYPCAYLHDGDRVVGEITINELLSN